MRTLALTKRATRVSKYDGPVFIYVADVVTHNGTDRQHG